MIKKRNGCNETRITKEVLTDSLLSPRGIVEVRILRSRSRSQGDEAVVNGREGLEDGSTIDWWSDDGLRGGFQGTASSRKRLDDSRASAWLGLPRVCLTQFLSLVQPTQLPQLAGVVFTWAELETSSYAQGWKGPAYEGGYVGVPNSSQSLFERHADVRQWYDVSFVALLYLCFLSSLEGRYEDSTACGFRHRDACALSLLLYVYECTPNVKPIGSKRAA